MFVKETMRILGKSYSTVRRWADQGRIRTTKLDNGRVMYWDEDVYRMVGKRVSRESLVAVYARVAGTGEKDRVLMAEQLGLVHSWCASRGVSVDRIYEDWARATDYSLEGRPGLHMLLQDIIQRRIAAVVVETPDRLARIGRELIEEICAYYGINIVYVNKAIKRPEYLAEQERDLTHLLKLAKVDRLEELGADILPRPKKVKLTRPGKIVPEWEGAPLPPTSRDLLPEEDGDGPDLSDLM